MPTVNELYPTEAHPVTLSVEEVAELRRLLTIANTAGAVVDHLESQGIPDIFNIRGNGSNGITVMAYISVILSRALGGVQSIDDATMAELKAEADSTAEFLKVTQSRPEDN